MIFSIFRSRTVLAECPRLRRACFALAAVAVPALLSPAGADVVVLKDGMELRGRVIDLGTNSIELQMRSGASRRINLKDIRKASFELSKEEPARKLDRVFRKNGSELAGDVKYSEDGKRVVVIRTDASGRRSQVEIPREEIARIIMRDQEVSEGAAVYSEQVRDGIKASLGQLGGTGPEVAKAEERLASYGIFAISEVREARKSAKEGSPAAKALARIERLYKLREITPDLLQDLRDYYRILTSGSAEEKSTLLEEMFTRYLQESVPVARFLVLDPEEDHKIRALAVALLGQNGFNRELVEIYSDPSGGQV